MNGQTAQASLAPVIQSLQEYWTQCADLPEEGLLRLSLLRDAMRKLHAEKSSLLARGDRSQVALIKSWEDKVHRLREAPTLRGELMAQLEGEIAAGRRSRILPQALYNQISRERLERYDRQWENLLAAEACQLGWRFWALSGKVAIDRTSESDLALQSALWPNAVVLFSEPATDVDGGIEGEFWHGRWLMVIEPHFKSAEDLHLNLAGIPGGVPDSWRWKLLFSPRSRSPGVAP